MINKSVLVEMLNEVTSRKHTHFFFNARDSPHECSIVWYMLTIVNGLLDGFDLLIEHHCTVARRFWRTRFFFDSDCHRRSTVWQSLYAIQQLDGFTIQSLEVFTDDLSSVIKGWDHTRQVNVDDLWLQIGPHGCRCHLSIPRSQTRHWLLMF